MSPEAKRIKKNYCGPAFIFVKAEIRNKLPSYFQVEQFIWVDAKLPEYRVAIPEVVSEWADDEGPWRNAYGGIQTRTLTYVPTGKIIYDNTLPPATAIVWQYKLQSSRDLVK